MLEKHCARTLQKFHAPKRMYGHTISHLISNTPQMVWPSIGRICSFKGPRGWYLILGGWDCQTLPNKNLEPLSTNGLLIIYNDLPLIKQLIAINYHQLPSTTGIGTTNYQRGYPLEIKHALLENHPFPVDFHMITSMSGKGMLQRTMFDGTGNIKKWSHYIPIGPLRLRQIPSNSTTSH